MASSCATDCLQWCLQGHLNTDNYRSACRGLERTRRFRSLTLPLRNVIRFFIDAVLSLRDWICKVLEIKHRPQKSLLWTKRNGPYKDLGHYRAEPGHEGGVLVNPPQTPRLAGVDWNGPSISIQTPSGATTPHDNSDAGSSIPLMRLQTPDTAHASDRVSPRVSSESPTLRSEDHLQPNRRLPYIRRGTDATNTPLNLSETDLSATLPLKDTESHSETR